MNPPRPASVAPIMPAFDYPRKGRSHPMERWGRIIMCFGLVGFGCLFFRWLRPADNLPTLLGAGGFMLPCIVGSLLIMTGRRRGASEVLGRGGRLCPRCRYPVTHVAEMGVCPECGEPFTQQDNLAAWRAKYPWLRL